MLDQRIAALDELEMATTTLRFRQPGEPLADPPDSSVIEIRAVESHQLQFQSDLLLGREELRKHLGQLRYLQTLEKVCCCYYCPEPIVSSLTTLTAW